MTAASEAIDRAKRFRVFRNGDPRFYGKEFVLNKRRIRTWESFLQQVTNDVKFTEAVRSIRTPVGGTKVKSLDDLQDSKHYVAVGNSRFNKNIRYLELEDHNRRNNHATSPRFLEVKPVEHSRIQVSGKIRKIPTDVMTIFVYSNGNELQQAKRVTLTRPMLQRWDAILEEVTNKVGNLTTCLYTLDGTKITNPASLQKGNFYVAVDKRFKKLDYGAQRPGFNTSPKQRRKLMPIMAPQRRGRKLRTGSDQLGRATMDNSVASSESEKSPKSYISTASNPLHNRPPPNRRPLARKKLEKKEDETIFHAKPVKHRRNNDKVEEIDYDKDEGGVFKAKGVRQETDNAEVVQETKDTKVDLPIDQVEAEEVEEEIEVEVKKGKKKAKKAISPTPRSPTPERQNSISEQPRSPKPTKTPTPPVKSRPKKTPRRSSTKEASDKSQSNHTTPRRSPSQNNGEHDPQTENGQLSDDANANKENEAASKIQANYRGYRTRKSLSKGEKESRPLEEK